MQILRSARRLPRRPIVAASPAPLHSLSSPSRHLLSFMASPAPRWWPTALARRSFPLMAAPNSPVRRASRCSHGPRNMATINRVQRDESGKWYPRFPTSFAKVIMKNFDTDVSSAITQGTKNFNTDNSKNMKNIEKRSRISEVVAEHEMNDKEIKDIISDAWGQNMNLIGCEEDHTSATKGHTAEIMVSEGEEFSDDEGYTARNILQESRHLDGSMYRGMDMWWKKEYHVADHNETRLEAMRLSDPSDCIICNGTCLTHVPCGMLQIFSIELPKIPVDGGLVELYGYIAVRDNLDPLLNYIVNISRDDPITVNQFTQGHQVQSCCWPILRVAMPGLQTMQTSRQPPPLSGMQGTREANATGRAVLPERNRKRRKGERGGRKKWHGSLIKMVGPKRGIFLMDLTLFEYDMRIKTGEQEKDDLQLIDGASLIGPQGVGDQPFLLHIASDCGAVDINLSCLFNAVEATIEVLISEVQSSFYLSLGCLTSGYNEEIWLFDGTIAESCGLKRSVVAVVMDSLIDLKFKLGAMSSKPDQRCCSFMAKDHGHDTQEIKTDSASFSVKLTWSALI